MKFNNKFNRFTLKVPEKVKLEFLLMALGHNLRKLSTIKSAKSKKQNTKPLIAVLFEHINRSLIPVHGPSTYQPTGRVMEI